MNPKINLRFKRLRPSTLSQIPLPAYQSADAAGMDLMADIETPVILKSGERKLVPTGLSVELPSGYEAQIRARSGLALKKGIGLVNAPGTIDADYRGEVGIIMINWGEEDFEIKRGDRIAQMVIAPITRVTVIESDDLSSTDRSSGGFGSTGI